MITNRNNQELDFESAVLHMDDEIRDYLSELMSPCTDQEFFSAYEERHLLIFGEEWELSKANPVW